MSLTDAERALYEWQLPVTGLGEAGQEKLKAGTVLVSRVGGVGGVVAEQLAVAGLGRLILAHAGDLRANDLNRQTLMSYDGIGRPRVEQAAQRLRQLNPFVQIETVGENTSANNAARLVAAADVVVGCAPLFEERLLMNREAVRRGKPYIDCAMFEMELHLMTVLPGKTPCLACLVPSAPRCWERRFPVLGAVAGTAGSLGAMEAIKVLTGLGEPLAGQMLIADLAAMTFRRVALQRRPDCPVCGGL
jgi:molybdopterin/thiamine biosynthesis adenylyltransferase